MLRSQIVEVSSTGANGEAVFEGDSHGVPLETLFKPRYGRLNGNTPSF